MRILTSFSPKSEDIRRERALPIAPARARKCDEVWVGRYGGCNRASGADGGAADLHNLDLSSSIAPDSVGVVERARDGAEKRVRRGVGVKCGLALEERTALVHAWLGTRNSEQQSRNAPGTRLCSPVSAACDISSL